jgi:hypothetical protein
MNLDDLMAVWREQDTAPLHGVNETLLRLALRQDEAKLRAGQRRQKWFVYISLAVLVGFMAIFLAIMIYPYDDDVLSGWDYVVAGVGLAAALILSGMVYAGFRAQAVREQRFGESLRDRLNWQITVIDSVLRFTWADWKNVAILVLGIGASAALSFLAARVNDAPLDEMWPVVRGSILYSLIAVGVTGWLLRRWVRRDLLPRKRRLETLLKELDGP